MQCRQALDLDARLAADARSKADQLAAAAANEKTLAFEKAGVARRQRLQAEKAALGARRASRRAHIVLAWAAFRNASPLTVGLVTLGLGIGAGMLSRDSGRLTPSQAPIVAEPAVLKLDAELASIPLKSAR